MNKLEFNGHKLEMFDSIQELPIYRFQLYNLNLMLDAGIGSDINDFDSRCNNVRRLMVKDQEAASRELHNMQQLIRFFMSNTSPKIRSFVVLIHKIDGVEVKESELTDEGISDIIKKLSEKGFARKLLDSFLDAVKKKVDFEFEAFFPKMVNGPKIKEFYTNLKKRTLLVLDNIEDQSQEAIDTINKIDQFIFSAMKPKKFNEHDGVEVQMILGFEETCILLSQHNVSKNPRSMTTLSFYQALEIVKDQLKPKK